MLLNTAAACCHLLRATAAPLRIHAAAMSGSSLPYPRAAVSITVLRHDDDGPSGRQYLLAQRANAPGKGNWSLPGGKIELGENYLGAAARELLEETNLGPSSVRLSPWPIGASDVIIPGVGGGEEDIQFHYVITQLFAFAEAGAEPRSGDDAAAVRWATLEEIESGSFALGGDIAAVLRRAEMLIACGALQPENCVEVNVP